MTPLLLILCLVLVVLQVALPRKWAFVPILIAVCHTTHEPFVGALTVTRVVIIVGLLRAAANSWVSWSPKNPMDLLVGVFACLAVFSTVGHVWDYDNPLIDRLRLVVDVMGTYLYMRSYLWDGQALLQFSTGLALVILPFAFFLLLEKQSGLNSYAAVGAKSLISMVREGKIRAQGPFGTPILTGTVGAICFPLLIPLWRTKRRLAIAGLIACLVVVYSSASSGPVGTLFLGLGAMFMWKWRDKLKSITIAAFVFLVILHFVKKRPIWYLMDLMDIVGGSTGWHRAYLIDMAIQHMNEWWLLGSDFTRHWMPYGLVATPFHCDLTNYYVYMGVMGGLPLLIALVVIQWKTFAILYKRTEELRAVNSPEEFGLWCLGSTMFAHAVTFLSISYYDQIYVFFWGLIGGLAGFIATGEKESSDKSDEPVVEEIAVQSPLVWGRGLAGPRAAPHRSDPRPPDCGPI